MKTPYTLVFGREPLEAIPRNVQKDEVLNAFQVLGYYTSKYNGDYKKAIPEFKSYLEDYVYEKVLSEMSEKDRVFACAIAKTFDEYLLQNQL